MRPFDRFLGIDYSGAKTASARLDGLQVYACDAGGVPAKHGPAAALRGGRQRNWTRAEVAQNLLDEACKGVRYLAGIDHNLSFPLAYFQRYGLTNWPAFLDDFVRHWPARGDGVSVEQLRAGAQRVGASHELRLCERWSGSAKSVFLFDVQGSVAKSSHAGIPWIAWLREQAPECIHVWPFDGWQPPEHKAVIVEAYPTLYRRRYAREGRSDHEHDAYAIARWMADMAGRAVLPELFAPPLSDAERRIADLEGWIFGLR